MQLNQIKYILNRIFIKKTKNRMKYTNNLL